VGAPDQPWKPALTSGTPALRFEQMNQPEVMTAWEMRCHVDYLLGHVASAVPAGIVKAIERFIFEWHAAWAEHGNSDAGTPGYRTLVRSMREELAELGAGDIQLTNEAPLPRALDALIFSRALGPSDQPLGTARAPANPKAAC
jgi:hypothetical protein